MDMNGGPFSYKWINSNPLPKVWEQMNLAHEYGANRIWIVNVGDLKPLEIPIEFFLRMAWDPEALTKDKIAEYQCAGPSASSAKSMPRRSPTSSRNMRNTTDGANRNWLQARNLQPDQLPGGRAVFGGWNEILQHEPKKSTTMLPQEQRDAFYELVLHPVRACANLDEMYIAAGRNQLVCRAGAGQRQRRGRARTRNCSEKTRNSPTTTTTKLAGGKWDHMMDQTHHWLHHWYLSAAERDARRVRTHSARYGRFGSRRRRRSP